MPTAHRVEEAHDIQDSEEEYAGQGDFLGPRGVQAPDHGDGKTEN